MEERVCNLHGGRPGAALGAVLSSEQPVRERAQEFVAETTRWQARTSGSGGLAHGAQLCPHAIAASQDEDEETGAAI